MTPEARLQAAIEILSDALQTNQPVDRFLKYWFSGRRFAGSKDRAAISEHVYGALRRRGEFAWRMKSEVPRAVLIGSLLDEGLAVEEIKDLFERGNYGPKPLSEDERHALDNPPTDDPLDHVLGGYPKWLEPELQRAFGKETVPQMQAMLARAPVDLRVNSLRAKRDDMLTGLRSLDFDASKTPYSPDGIRIPTSKGLGALRHTQFFQTGAIEIQDESSQIAALVCGSKPGMRVLDLAAGAGGKSLALAAIMQNKGEIIACDSNAKRLAQLAPRARRAGANIIRSRVLGKEKPQGKFDIVLVDAPCSGSGTWRRSPEMKWRLTEEKLKAFASLQSHLLERASSYVCNGGRLIFATCSILPKENTDRITAFLSRVEGFETEDVSALWASAVGTPAPPGLGHFFVGTPASTGTDGFFACALARK
jgi:16S rRNA (cytosine967-C5)-methyltransferase